MANYFEFSFELTVDWIFVRAISLYGTITNRNFGRSNPKTVWYNSGPWGPIMLGSVVIGSPE